MRFRSRAHKKADPLDGYNDAMQRALVHLAKAPCVASRGFYVPGGAPETRISAATIAALDRRFCISWVAQHDRNDATLTAKGRAQAFIVTQRAAQAAEVRAKLRSGS